MGSSFICFSRDPCSAASTPSSSRSCPRLSIALMCPQAAQALPGPHAEAHPGHLGCFMMFPL